MIYRFKWSVTNDYFDVEPIDEEFSHWYADRCIFNNTKFQTSVFDVDHDTPNVDKLIETAKSDLAQINFYLNKLKLCPIEITDWFSQQELNRVHKEWNCLIRDLPKFEKFVYKNSQDAFRSFHQINRLIHKIENSFKYYMRCHSHWRETNPFEGKTYPTGVFNVSLIYNDFGRNAMEKFVNFSEDPNDVEFTAWNSLGPNIKINLVKPYIAEYPKEFIEYCIKHNIPVQDHYIPFGNLVNCKNMLGPVRELMNRNYQIRDNYLSIEKITN